MATREIANRPHEYEAEREETTRPLSALPLCPQSARAWPTIDGAAFFGLPGEVVRSLDPETEADPVAVLATYLTMFGATVGSGPHAAADGAPHPARLFAVIVGETSKARKGTSYAQVRRIFVGADMQFTGERVLGGFGSGEAFVDAVASGDDRRLLVVEPEWARILSVSKRDGSTLSPLMRQAWDGDRLAVRSRGAGLVSADGAHVGVVGHVTIEELRAKLTDTELANGFANRHLFVCAKRSKLLPSGGVIDESLISDLARKTAKALDSARDVGLMHRTPAAEELWSTLYYEMAEDEPGGLLEAVIARDAAQVLRLSVAYALSDSSHLIGVEHVEAAWAFWSYCRESAAYIFGDSLGSPVADRLLQALRASGVDGLDGRQLDRALGGHVSAVEVRATLDLLNRRGFILTRDEETGGRPRRVTYARTATADKAEQANKGSSR